MKTVIATIALLSITTTCVLARSGGAPVEACERLLPQHVLTSPQKDTPPYELSTVEEVVGQSWLITIRGVTPEFVFKGLIIQARDADEPDNYTSFGSFSLVGGAENDLQTVTCLSDNDTATHTNNNEKEAIQLRWTKPDTGSGRVVFSYTVAAAYNKYWGVIRSQPLEYRN